MNAKRKHTGKVISLLAKQRTRDKERITYTLTDKAKEALKDSDANAKPHNGYHCLSGGPR